MGPDQLVSLALEEYKSLREEVVNSVDRQYSLANWGISATVVLIAALAGGWATLRQFPYLLAASALVAVPAVATSYVVAWTHVISKIAQLGSRLREIEDNVSRSVAVESIRQTYGLDASEHVDPFKYLLGWEHKLWRAGTNSRVETTVGIVKLALAVLYAGAIAIGVLVLAKLENPPLGFLVQLTIAATVLWGLVWGIIAWHLRSVNS